jgi:hypothetical protein
MGVQHRHQTLAVPNLAFQRVFLELASGGFGSGVVSRLDPFGKVEMTRTLQAVKLVTRNSATPRLRASTSRETFHVRYGSRKTSNDAKASPVRTIRWQCLTCASAEFADVQYRRLMRYFFDTRDNGTFIEDDIGIEFADLDSVKTQAALSLAEMARDVLPGSIRRVLSVEVRDAIQPILRDVLTFETIALAN